MEAEPMLDAHRIRTEEELREVIAAPSPVLEQKVFDRIDRYARRFIEQASLVFVATVGPDGDLDVSPKGDGSGFVAVEDERTLLLPERPGNRLAYGFHNILARPKVGLIFVVPGVSETLRVNGGAELTRDPAILDRLSARSRPAILATRVRVEESFFHCGKAFIRSSAWKPETWPKGFKAGIGRQFAEKAGAGDELAERIEADLQRDYRERL
jgi:PPOX class probable FMN-dependent enzyme